MFRQIHNQKHSGPQAVPSGTLLLAIVCVCLSAGGCRALTKKTNQKMALTSARQFSLRGFDALQQKKYNDAETLFSESLRRCPTDERAHWGLAEVLYQRGDCQLAAQHMNEAAKMSGSNPDLFVRLGEMQMEAGRADMAIIQTDLALSNDWQHAKAWELRGRVLEKNGQPHEAMEAYHRSLMSQPNNPSVQLALASIYQQLGRPQRALATLERLSDSQSPEFDKADTWMLKGAALASLGQIEDSRMCLREASLRVGKDDTQLCLQLAKLQADMGDLADARANLGRVLSLNPGDQSALSVQQQLEQKFRELPANSASNSAIANNSPQVGNPATTARADIISVSGPTRTPSQRYPTAPNAEPLLKPGSN